jgi:hypothetical protein
VSSVKFVSRGSNCTDGSAKVFQASQIVTKTVMPKRNAAVPIQRANASLHRPNVSCENDGVGTNRRRNSCGWSRRSTSVDRRRGPRRSGRSATTHLGAPHG